MTKVMMVGTSENSGGGISSVIRLMKKMHVWEKYSCYWLGTQIQSCIFWKFWYMIKAATMAPFIMWRYDIIHFHIVPGITLFIQLPELLVAKLYGKKVITEVHVGNQLINYSRNRFFKWWLNQADLILLLAYKWQDLLSKYYSEVKTPINVIYNPCEPISAIDQEDKKKLIIFAGVLNENKAPNLLLEAWSRLKTSYPEWRLAFLGNGDVKKYKNQAETLKIDDVVEFTGHIVGEAKSQKFIDASIFCMSSYEEGFPMVVLEAWANSIAVITTPVGGLPDVISEGKNCLTFPFGDVDKLACQLERLIKDEQLRKRISETGHEYAQKHFSLNAISDRLDMIYSELVNS